MPDPNTAPAIAVAGVAKAFGPTQALAGADLSVRPGEVVALMGANGAGKSTLVKIISGSLQPDAGTVTLGGRVVAFSSPREAKAAGIATVHQATDQAGAAGLTVAENLLLDEFCGSGPLFISPGSVRRRARAVASALDLDLPLDRDFIDLRPAERQLIAIARAVAAKATVLILDEPTSSLSTTEAERLFSIIRRLKASGMAILYISHRLGDLAAIADRAVVLRGGRIVGEFEKPIDLSAAVTAMIGRRLEAAAHADGTASTPVVVSIAGAMLVPGARPFDLSLHSGEVVAITGTLGSGKSRLLRSLFGLERLAAGGVTIEGAPWQSSGPAESIANGVFLVAEDRWQSSLLPPETPGASIAGTIALPHLPRWFPFGVVDTGRERRIGNEAIARLGIKARSADDTLDQLSGGNQQKVVLARWQAAPCRLLLLDEPFQGVDVGARADLIAAIRNSQSASATLIATSDTEEALEVADRILVMRDHSLYAAEDGLVSPTDTIAAVETAETRTAKP
ncbi:sugar ABC transporter ATP-binding protein [Kaistia geumhonensis]|uniref:Simple sugar transport system ATP-binding protein n=1 Tax=Kaistia geumhonensis TaxID=410839 RepID=A0ABU0M4L1_9HYPH|nr:sugar ABC transporter ATP-binding protein [Kaistia geumhonensis]MCX5478890.1 sugar ABC transporter ATP-binding protein [Kaistia geumhonensis]MDQ0515891.1 simple sugar transport system ATP-binding protein [Kaistia geumhonensis]